MTKDQIRNLYKQKRNAISELEKIKWDDLLLIQFQQLNLSAFNTILSFWPIADKMEPNVELMTRYLRLIIPEIAIAYPISNTNDFSMKAILTDEETVFKKNEWGIFEPEQGVEIKVESIDLVFVPLLAFDKNGYRVGYGKGYYDRFLTQSNTHIVKIGFSYFDPIEQITDTNQFDVPLNFCITPQHIYEF